MAENPNEPDTQSPKGILRLPTELQSVGKGESRVKNTYFDELDSEKGAKFQKTLEDVETIGNNRKRFWNMLVDNVAKAGYVSPQGRQVEILDLACGRCEEGIVLNAFFAGENFGSTSPRVKLTGIDLNANSIEKAIKSYGDANIFGSTVTYALPSNFEFIVGDAKHLDKYPNVPEKADVVVIRHQQISSNELSWMLIFYEALDRLSPEGIIIITSYSDEEHEMMMEILGKQVEVLVNKKNHWAKTLGNPKISEDRHVAIIRPKKRSIAKRP